MGRRKEALNNSANGFSETSLHHSIIQSFQLDFSSCIFSTPHPLNYLLMFCFNNLINILPLQMMFSHLKYPLAPLSSPLTEFYSSLKTQLICYLLREALSKRTVTYIQKYFGQTISVAPTTMCTNYLISYLTIRWHIPHGQGHCVLPY